MTVALIVVILLLAALAAGIGRRHWQRRHPEPLRGDWWSQFERDFARHVARRSREGRPSSRRDAF